MNYIATIKEQGITLRFFNPVNGGTGHTEMRGLSFVREGEMDRDEIISLPVVNDGLVPLEYPDGFDKPGISEESNRILGSMLLVVSYCANCMAKNSELDQKAIMLQERLDMLYAKSINHSARLKTFTLMEKERDDFFSTSEDMWEMLETLKKSAKELTLASDDIITLLGDYVPSDFLGQL